MEAKPAFDNLWTRFADPHPLGQPCQSRVNFLDRWSGLEIQVAASPVGCRSPVIARNTDPKSAHLEHHAGRRGCFARASSGVLASSFFPFDFRFGDGRYQDVAI